MKSFLVLSLVAFMSTAQASEVCGKVVTISQDIYRDVDEFTLDSGIKGLVSRDNGLVQAALTSDKTVCFENGQFASNNRSRIAGYTHIVLKK